MHNPIAARGRTVLLAGVLVWGAACQGRIEDPNGHAGSGGVGTAGSGGNAGVGGGAGDSPEADMARMGGGGGSGGQSDMARPPQDMAKPPQDGGSCQLPSSGTRTAPAFPPPTVSTSGLLVRVMNHCPFSLWVVGQGNSGGTTLQPNNAELKTDQTRDYDAGNDFESARLTVYRDNKIGNPAQFVELNYAGGQVGYNVSYVDFVGLPAEATASCGTTACYSPVASLLDGCPSNLREPDRCDSARSWCSNPNNGGQAFCKALDTPAQAAMSLSQCQSDLAAYRAAKGAGAAIGTTPSVYSCSDFWSWSPFCCAIVNRGVPAASASNSCAYYKNPPFNTYAKWVHDKCPMIYAFPYDDAEGQSGYHQCAAKELRITWCPGG